MRTFFIISPEVVASTDWSPKTCLNMSPALIRKGEHKDSYAVDTYCFQSDPAYEQYRELLESFPTADLEQCEDWFPAPDPPEE